MWISRTLPMALATLAFGTAAAIVASRGSAEPQPSSLAQLRTDLPALASGARISVDSSVVRATPIAPDGDPVVDVSTVRQARGVDGPAAVVASTRDGAGACVGAEGVLACAPRTALQELGAVYGLATDPETGVKLVALTLKPDAVITAVNEDGSREPLQATDGVISAQLDVRPKELQFTRPDGRTQTITTSLPRP